MTIEAIQIRQLANRHLLQPADKMTVLHDLCGVQAQFMGNVLPGSRLYAHSGAGSQAGNGSPILYAHEACHHARCHVLFPCNSRTG